MKKLLLLISIFYTFSIKAQTSIYHPFPDSNAAWNIHYYLNCLSSAGTSEANYSISISGDTLIGAQVYHKLFTPFVQTISAGCGRITAGYKGAVREDTVNKKVFYVPSAGSTEQLLYDFTMQVGDTVKGYLEPGVSSQPETVQSIDSVLVGSNYHKRWNINTNYNLSFIEGIGSTFGLIEPLPGNLMDMPYFTITCFTQNSLTLYPNTTTYCQLINSVKSFDKNSNQITVYPNPNNGQFSIILNTKENNDYLLELFNPIGQTIIKKKFSCTHGIYAEDVNITGLSKGVYFYSVSNDNQKTRGKFLVE